jgi:hypothetical protein
MVKWMRPLCHRQFLQTFTKCARAKIIAALTSSPLRRKGGSMTKKIGKTVPTAKLTVSLERHPFDADGLPASYRDSVELQVGRFGPREMKKAQVDAEMIASLFRKHPKEITAMANHMMAGRTIAAREIASTIGLTEEVFQENGGGLFWVAIIVVGAAILTYAALHKP